MTQQLTAYKGYKIYESKFGLHWQLIATPKQLTRKTLYVNVPQDDDLPTHEQREHGMHMLKDLIKCRS